MRIRLTLLTAALFTLSACGGSPPTKSLTEARTAINGAILAKKCAPEDYAAAERMYTKAQTLSAQKKYDEAERAAEAAKKLAQNARRRAEERRAECFANADSGTTNLGVDQFIDNTDPTVVAGIEVEGMKTVYFDFNAADLTSEARETMTNNAAWMSANAGRQVILEGHCDSRGSTEYNLALGEKRGYVAKKYLRQMGADVANLEVVSFGEERPSDYGENEAAFARNRRVEFTVR